ncbi:MAG: hypothetical protein HYY87_04165 [Candidatus Levybacteria bacterium]|nr:hypothetical protein [Candidatus Levybacteria bacterium]
MEMENNLPSNSTNPSQENANQPPSPTNQNEIPNASANRPGMIIVAVTVVIIMIVLGVGGYFLLNQKTSKSHFYDSQNNTPIPTQSSKEENAKEIGSTTEEKILYAENGFLFYYPGSLELYQEYAGDAVQWKPKSADRIAAKENLDALTLHESSSPLPAIITNGKYTIWNKGYVDARTDVNVTSVKEELISSGQNKSSLFTIECGNGCHYAIARFSSNKNYYEFIYNLNSGNISIFKDILSSLSFFDQNVKEWKIYISNEGGYSVQYPANFTVLEKVFASVDGVRGYSRNSFKAFPRDSSPIVDALSVYYKIVGNKTLDEYLKENQCAIIEQKKRFTLSGEPAEYQSTACGIAGSSDVFVKHKDKLYTIGVSSPEDPILATFKFTD